MFFNFDCESFCVPVMHVGCLSHAGGLLCDVFLL